METLAWVLVVACLAGLIVVCAVRGTLSWPQWFLYAALSLAIVVWAFSVIPPAQGPALTGIIALGGALAWLVKKKPAARPQ